MLNELYHFGIKGMKWGVRRYQNPDGTLTAAGKKRTAYRSTGIRSAIAKRQNEKVDKNFKKWKENTNKREDAIALGKKANESRRAYEADKKNSELKNSYRADKKAYKKALGSNTTYRKGQIKKEVGSDMSRKYLSDAKKIEKQLKADPTNKSLKKQYSSLMSKHDVERAKARRAPIVAANRSRRIASAKRSATLAAKAAVGSAAIAGGTYLANEALKKHGKKISINHANVRRAVNIGKKIMRYV